MRYLSKIIPEVTTPSFATITATEKRRYGLLPTGNSISRLRISGLKLDNPWQLGFMRSNASTPR
jgi:hypothetical protein